ncbi:tetratricopeptide repeat protein [Streptomyces sp. NPDC050428]|uniref:tetratricopeptide repeat protein n=1 Tax=Streptomyces sp. NPDC050428 TaxID=3155757 RepID=UPI0034259796
MDNDVDADPPYRPWGTVTSEFWHNSQPEQPDTADVRARISQVRELLAAGRPGEASALAEHLDQAYTAAYGPTHQSTIEVREVRGYLAGLTGDHATALTWYLHAARLRAAAGPQHPETVQATLRAYSLWHTVPAPHAHRLGLELLATVVDIHGADSDIAHRTRARLTALGEAPISPR